MPEIWQGAWKLSPLQDLLAFRTADQTKFGCYIFVQVTVTGSQSAALFGTDLPHCFDVIGSQPAGTRTENRYAPKAV